LARLSSWVLASCSGYVPALTRPFPPGRHPGPPPTQRCPLDGTQPLANSRRPAPHWPLGAQRRRSPFTLSFHTHATTVTSHGIHAFGPCHSHSPPLASFPVLTRSIGHLFTDGPPFQQGVHGFLPIPTPAGTRVDWIKGNVTASFALDGPVVPSTPLSQIRRRQPGVPLCNYPISLTSPVNSYGIYNPPTLPSLALTAFPSVLAHGSHNKPVRARVDHTPLHALAAISQRLPMDIGVEAKGRPGTSETPHCHARTRRRGPIRPRSVSVGSLCVRQ